MQNLLFKTFSRFFTKSKSPRNKDFIKSEWSKERNLWKRKNLNDIILIDLGKSFSEDVKDSHRVLPSLKSEIVIEIFWENFDWSLMA